MKRAKQMSESIELGIVLALAGGFMDAYSYICRDHVFANAQTGNLLLLGVHLSSGEWTKALRYFCPVLSFAIGISIAVVVRMHLKEKEQLHWRQIAVAIEAVVLLVVSVLPFDYNLLANSMTSLACGIQVESFRKIHGNGCATTMCIGNLRSAVEHICTYFYTKNKQMLRTGMLYLSIILCFIVGAVFGNLVVEQLQQRAILVCSGILFIAFFMMFSKRHHKGELYSR